jgi:hypothetical protein
MAHITNHMKRTIYFAHTFWLTVPFIGIRPYIVMAECSSTFWICLFKSVVYQWLASIHRFGIWENVVSPSKASLLKILVKPFTIFFFFLRLGFEHRSLHLQSRCSNAWAIPPVHVVLVILVIGSHELFTQPHL